jgi:hypothetical protein
MIGGSFDFERHYISSKPLPLFPPLRETERGIKGGEVNINFRICVKI